MRSEGKPHSQGEQRVRGAPRCRSPPTAGGHGRCLDVDKPAQAFTFVEEAAMSRAVRALHRVTIAAAALGSCARALAQATEPRAGDTFMGINIGKPTYSTSCGTLAGLSCSNNGTSVSVTAGDMITRNWGAELSYLDLGKADRG